MIKVDTFNFLKELAANNNREWFAKNKASHDGSRENILGFAGTVIKGLAETDRSIPADLDPKDCVMRIYRDIRFSLDKTPYKTNFGVGISPNGKNFNGPGYYLHISPEECFVAGGCWMPETDQLKLIRQEIDYNSSDFKHSLDEFFRASGNGRLDTDHKLKTTPKGYDANHQDIEYLRLKSYTVTVPLQRSDLTKPNATDTVVKAFTAIHPFIVFLRNAIS
ncbi:DUF2461 domain-containing protein [Flavihumibacter sp. R14]|nr:DUF2461 domain-containing protein [Flavihumibacter soli]